MEKVLLYITSHYIYFVIAAAVLIISAIGFVIDEKKQGLAKAKEVPMTEEEIKAAQAKEEAARLKAEEKANKKKK